MQLETGGVVTFSAKSKEKDFMAYYVIDSRNRCMQVRYPIGQLN